MEGTIKSAGACVCVCALVVCGRRMGGGSGSGEKRSQTRNRMESADVPFLVVSCLLTEAEPKGIAVNNEFPF